MPNTSSAKKKLRGDARKSIVNRRIKNRMKQALKGLADSPSQENLAKAYAALDVAAKKHIVTKQRASRSKSQAAKLVGSLPRSKTVAKTKPKRKKKTA